MSSDGVAVYISGVADSVCPWPHLRSGVSGRRIGVPAFLVTTILEAQNDKQQRSKNKVGDSGLHVKGINSWLETRPSLRKSDRAYTRRPLIILIKTAMIAITRRM